jgi:hypothetical protein
MIGTGPWIYKEWIKGGTIKLEAYSGFYRTADEIDTMIVDFFWKNKGDVSAKASPPSDVGAVSGTDIVAIVANWGQNVPWCDIVTDGIVNYLDLDVVTTNYGKVSG